MSIKKSLYNDVFIELLKDDRMYMYDPFNPRLPDSVITISNKLVELLRKSSTKLERVILLQKNNLL